jgi:hypothetical protein
VATLRNLVNGWADQPANRNRTLSRTFAGDGLRHQVSVSISDGEVKRVEIL